MSLYWNSFSDFIHMGGYGLYVWGSTGMAVALMLIEPILAARRHRRALAQAADGENE